MFSSDGNVQASSYDFHVLPDCLYPPKVHLRDKSDIDLPNTTGLDSS
jgi:hypothetical protein